MEALASLEIKGTVQQYERVSVVIGELKGALHMALELLALRERIETLAQHLSTYETPAKFGDVYYRDCGLMVRALLTKESGR